jgi:aminoglycoside phosphotransferase (APT) family kinase protein
VAAVSALGGVVTEVVPRTGGQLSTVHEVRFANADPVIVKQYADEWRWKQAKEVHVYRLLAEFGVGPVPRVVHVDAERAVTVLTLLPGRPLSEVALGPDALRAAYRRMGELLAALHRITQPAYGYVTTGILDPEPDNPAYMGRQFAGKLAEFAALGGPVALHDAVRDRVASQDHLFASCTGAVLCHNDFHEGNVLVDAAGVVTGFVDVENVIAADPLVDLAKTVQYDLDASPVKRAGLLDGYGPLPADAMARIRLYRLYHALELWDWFASIGDTAPLPGIAADIHALATG